MKTLRIVKKDNDDEKCCFHIWYQKVFIQLMIVPYSYHINHVIKSYKIGNYNQIKIL
jgi:hypothetical protein